MTMTIGELVAQATLSLQSGQYDEAKQSFKICIDSALANGDLAITNTVILNIAQAYQDGASGQQDILQYDLNSLNSMREIFPQDNDNANIQIAVALNNLYYDYPKDSDSATKLQLLGYLNEGLSVAPKIDLSATVLLTDLIKKIDVVCDDLFKLAAVSTDHQEELAIYSNIYNSIQNAFPEGHPKAGHYLANLGVAHLNLKDFQNGLLNLYKAVDITDDQGVIEGSTAQICQSTKALFYNTKTALTQKIAIVDYMSEHLELKSKNALECIVYMKSAMAVEYTKSAIIEWNKIMPSLDANAKQTIQAKIDSSCINLDYTNTADCLSAVIGLTVDSAGETVG